MIPDHDLRRLLTGAAEAYEPPAAGAQRVLERLDEGRDRRRLSSGHPVRILTTAAALVAVLFAVGVGALSAGRGRDVGSGSGSSAAPAFRSGAAGAQAPAAAPSALAPSSGSDTRVVRTGQVALEVPRGTTAAALDRLAAVATGQGGYVAESRSDNGPGTPAGSSTLRVPAGNFTATVGQVRRIGTVVGSSEQARDVTADYVDLSARITALRQTRDSYLTLLSKATSVGDVLSVQQQIQGVQTQIEQLQGRQKLLENTSDLATLAVTVTEAGAPTTTGPSRHGFGAALRSAGHGFNAGLQALIAVSGPLLFALLVLGALGLLARGAYRIGRRFLL